MPVVSKIKCDNGFRAECICDQCGNPFERPSWRVAKSGRTFCSHICHYTLQGGKPWAERTVTVNSRGYGTVSMAGKTYLLHRLIMEKMLGRKLESWEHVHHQDSDKLNNNPTNLELRTTNNHPSYIDANLKTINSLLQKIAELKQENASTRCGNL